jgi:hypothetical protein
VAATAPARKTAAVKKPASKSAEKSAVPKVPARRRAAAKQGKTAESNRPTAVGSPVKPVKLAKADKPLKAAKSEKAKLVRDSFTMPQADFDLVAILKTRALAFQRATKKSELLRAGLHALQALSDAKLQRVLDALVPLKAGRPKSGS